MAEPKVPVRVGDETSMHSKEGISSRTGVKCQIVEPSEKEPNPRPKGRGNSGLTRRTRGRPGKNQNQIASPGGAKGVPANCRGKTMSQKDDGKHQKRESVTAEGEEIN